MARRKGGRRFAPETKSNLIYKRFCYALALFMMLSFLANRQNLIAYFTDSANLQNDFSVTPTYEISYNANGGEGSMESQVVFYNVNTTLRANTFTREGYTFDNWNTQANGSGTPFSNEAIVTQTSFNNVTNGVTLYAQWEEVDENAVAVVNGVYYDTLQKAINAVPTNNTKTTVKLLKDTSETLTVASGKNILFNLQNYTISNSGSNNVIVNNGSIEIVNGTIQTDASQGAINNNSGATLKMSGGSIIATGSKQAIYNDGGTVEISGTAYLSSACTGARGTVHNLANSTMTITGGTIIGTKQSGVFNAGTLTIGDKDGVVSTTSPSIQGATYGVTTSTDINFYDGILKGKTDPINDITKIVDKETGYEAIRDNEVISGVTYKTLYLENGMPVYFDPTGGVVEETVRTVNIGDPIGTLPVPEYGEYQFDGWFTEETGGEEVTENTIVNTSITVYAHWSVVDVAEVNGNRYTTLQAAIDSIPTNTETTVTLLRDIRVGVTVETGQKIIFNLQNYTLKSDANEPVINNKGYTTITNGTIKSNADTYAAIDNKQNAHLYITGGTIIANGGRQAVYNERGYVEISGNPYMVSSAPERPTVQNIAGSTMIITGGTFVSNEQQAVYNLGNMTIGTKDGTISTSMPDMRGATYGITNTGTLSFYDGIAKGKTGSITGTILEIEDNSHRVTSTEVISGETYITEYLEND